MFLHFHPYQPFLFEEATRWIVGTLPPPRFTTGDLRPGDVNFCYGSRDGQLWTILDRIYGLDLIYEDNLAAVQQRTQFLREQGIGICDLVESACRDNMGASDLGMQQVQLRDLVKYLREYPRVKTLLFMGGNSKNGPEYLFRRLLKQYGTGLSVKSASIPRIHEFDLPPGPHPKLGGREIATPRVIRTISLTAPSGAANMAVGSLREYKDLKIKNPEINTLDFRVMQYRKHFCHF